MLKQQFLMYVLKQHSLFHIASADALHKASNLGSNFPKKTDN